MIAPLLVVLAAVAVQQRGADSTLREPSIITRAPIDTGSVVNFRVLVQPETLYVGQQATYQLGVFLDETVRDRLRRMEALAPEMRSMMAYDPPAPRADFPMRAVYSHRYEAHVYQRPIFPLSAGRFAIPPARLVYAMPLSYNFFSREESFELRSDSAVIVALDPPIAGRPSDWSGAVGVLRVSARLDTTGARVGDPIRLLVRVSGEGNVKLFPRPKLSLSWASVVPAGERVELSSDSLVIQGTKEFEWVLTPLSPGAHQLPSLRYPYFDPYAAQYDVARSDPLPLTVGPGSLASLDTSSAAARVPWPIRTRYRGALATPVYRSSGFALVMLLLPLPAIALVALGRPRPPRRAPRPAVRLRALARSASGCDVRLVRRVLLAAIADRLRLGAVAIAEPAALARAARRGGTSTAVAYAAANLLAELDEAAFSVGHRDHDPKTSARAWELYRAIDREARTPRAPSRTVATVVALFAVLALSASALAGGGAEDARAFARGVDAYARGQYALAERDFATAAARAPRAADAWANLGTAAFARADTVQAILGWQHALRLEPLAEDVRDRLELIAPASATAPGAVPPIPPAPLAFLAALLWTAGWLALAWRARRRRVRLRANAPLAAIGAALVVGAAAAALDARLRAGDLAVVAHESPLHILPALGAERGATLHAGEVARVVQREGAWSRVVADGDRGGWIDAASLAPLTTN